MCHDAVAAIARLAIAAAQAEFELQEALEQESHHRHLVARVEETLMRRKDNRALEMLRWAATPEPDVEAARALVEER